MNLEEIISAAVEKRVKELVDNVIHDRGANSYPSFTTVESAVSRVVSEIAKDEVTKHETAIRSAIQKALAEAPTRFEISAYSKINLPDERD